MNPDQSGRGMNPLGGSARRAAPRIRRFAAVLRAAGWRTVGLPLLLAACHGHGGTGDDAHPQANPLAALGRDEALHMAGTEPFWTATIHHDHLTYTTPEAPTATPVPVARFVGLNGIGFNGRLGDRPLQIAVMQGPCRDGMSDRTYPLTIMLRIGNEDRSGCGWTGAAPSIERGDRSGPAG